jgi:hypothetical protein
MCPIKPIVGADAVGILKKRRSDSWLFAGDNRSPVGRLISVQAVIPGCVVNVVVF